MNHLNVMDIIEKVYYGDIIEIVLWNNEAGDSVIYNGSAGNVFMMINTNALTGLKIIDIGNYVNDIGVAVTVFRLEEK